MGGAGASACSAGCLLGCCAAPSACSITSRCCSALSLSCSVIFLLPKVCWLRLHLPRVTAREDHPAVERSGPPSATSARPDPHRGCGPLDGVPQADVLLGDEPRQAHPVRLPPTLPWSVAPRRFVVHCARTSFLRRRLLPSFGNWPRRPAGAERSWSVAARKHSS